MLPKSATELPPQKVAEYLLSDIHLPRERILSFVTAGNGNRLVSALSRMLGEGTRPCYLLAPILEGEPYCIKNIDTYATLVAQAIMKTKH